MIKSIDKDENLRLRVCDWLSPISVAKEINFTFEHPFEGHRLLSLSIINSQQADSHCLTILDAFAKDGKPHCIPNVNHY